MAAVELNIVLSGRERRDRREWIAQVASRLGPATQALRRSSTVTDSGSGYELSVTHADVTRAGIAVPFHVRVRRAGGLDEPIQLAFSSSLLERFDFQNYYPNPSAETAGGRNVLYEFNPPPGDVFLVSLDARTAPDQNGSVETYRVRLMTGSVTAAQVDFRMVVVP